MQDQDEHYAWSWPVESKTNSAGQVEHLATVESGFGNMVHLKMRDDVGVAGILWPGAVSLMKYLDKTLGKKTFVGKRVLILGGGSGYEGISFAQIGAHVTLTDLDFVVPQMQHNVDLNSELILKNGGSVRVTDLGWGPEGWAKSQLSREAQGAQYDYIILIECVYEIRTEKLLLWTLTKLKGTFFCSLGARFNTDFEQEGEDIFFNAELFPMKIANLVHSEDTVDSQGCHVGRQGLPIFKVTEISPSDFQNFMTIPLYIHTFTNIDYAAAECPSPKSSAE